MHQTFSFVNSDYVVRIYLTHLLETLTVESRIAEFASLNRSEYISSDYLTAVRQNRGQSAALIAKGLKILLSHVSGIHANYSEDSWCKWR